MFKFNNYNDRKRFKRQEIKVAVGFFLLMLISFVFKFLGAFYVFK